MESSINVLFHLRKDKQTKEKLYPIYLRVTIDGGRIELSTQRCIEGAKWSTTGSRVKGGTEEAKRINTYIELLRHRVFIYQKELMLEGKEVTLSTFKNKWLGIVGDQRMVLEIFKEHNDRVEKLVGKDFAEGTLERYKTALAHTRSFILWKYKAKDLDITKLDYEFITDYEFWLKSIQGCAHNTTMKYLANFKKIVLICIKNGWLHKDPFFGYSMAKKEVVRNYLSDTELDTIKVKKFVSERVGRVRDIFLFCCYTGLAYADVKKLKHSEIQIGVDGQKWIFTSRQKTDTASRIPLLPTSLSIIKNYASHPECKLTGHLLPVLSNQKMNSYLKEIADVCGITKELTFHIARHTFATTITLNNGVPIETVSKMLGHTNLKTTQHYAKLLDLKVGKDMQQLTSVLKAKLKK